MYTLLATTACTALVDVHRLAPVVGARPFLPATTAASPLRPATIALATPGGLAPQSILALAPRRAGSGRRRLQRQPGRLQRQPGRLQTKFASKLQAPKAYVQQPVDGYGDAGGFGQGAFGGD